MSKLSKEQKDKVKQFISLAETNEATAQTCLAQYGWKLEHAVDAYFTQPSRFRVPDAKAAVERKKIEQLFNKYKEHDRDRNEERILTAGTIRLLEDLRLAPDNVCTLILAWKCQAKTQCEFSREEFMRGLQELGADSLDKISVRLQEAELELANNSKFRDLYTFSYDYAQQSATQKNLDLDSAVAYWRIILQGRFLLLDKWLHFVKEMSNNRSVPRDTWNLLFEFVVTVNGDCSKYDQDGAWPVLIDEFVDWVHPKTFSANKKDGQSGDEPMEY